MTIEDPAFVPLGYGVASADGARITVPMGLDMHGALQAALAYGGIVVVILSQAQYEALVRSASAASRQQDAS